MALKQFQNCAVVATAANGWMDTELTQVWVDSIGGAFAFNQRLWTWGSYKYYMEDKITESLKSKKVDHVILPRGCTKYIQAPDGSWNKPFKAACTKKVWWMAGNCRNSQRNGCWKLEGCNKGAILQSILDAWLDLPTEVIKESSRSCALKLSFDGSCDNVIHCFKDGSHLALGKLCFAHC